MKKKKSLGVSAVLVFLSLCFMLLICKDSGWAQNKKLFVEDELLIQFRIDTPKNKADEALNVHGATVADEIQQLRIKRIKVPAHVIDKVKEALSHNPHVEFVENNFLAEPSTTPNDSYYPSQWHLPKINAPSGWDITSGSESMPIAIIDSGVDPDHPDLAGKAHFALAPYWAKRLGWTELLACQVSKRGGLLRLRLEGDRVFIAGQAVTVVRGQLEPPPALR